MKSLRVFAKGSLPLCTGVFASEVCQNPPVGTRFFAPATSPVLFVGNFHSRREVSNMPQMTATLNRVYGAVNNVLSINTTCKQAKHCGLPQVLFDFHDPTMGIGYKCRSSSPRKRTYSMDVCSMCNPFQDEMNIVLKLRFCTLLSATVRWTQALQVNAFQLRRNVWRIGVNHHFQSKRQFVSQTYTNLRLVARGTTRIAVHILTCGNGEQLRQVSHSPYKAKSLDFGKTRIGGP